MKALAGLFALFIMMSLSICVMIFGWGLKPVSWGWVIWGGIGTVFVGALINAIGSET